ncbi:MAG: hybrid sensor histidine kinase/response regulator [Verrucomicrobia bacterium]|nr:MAG: hybrid sensor histidine kinase/response regulator [Verrucomicrobiota bacterium]
MERLRQTILFSFRAKVLAPVLLVMMLLLAACMWLVNERVIAQLHAAAQQQLASAEAVFKYSQTMRANALTMRFRSFETDSRFRAIPTMFDRDGRGLSDTSLKTLRGALQEIVSFDIAEAIVLATDAGQHLTVVRPPRLDDSRAPVEPAEFQASCEADIRRVLEHEVPIDAANGDALPRVKAVQCGDRLFDIVTMPIVLDNTAVGSVTFGMENLVTREFSQLSESQLILLLNGRPAQSTLSKTDLRRFTEAARVVMADPDARRGETAFQEVVLNGEHYLGLAGRLSARDDLHQLGYVFLSSYEKPLLALHETQRRILLVSVVAMLIGSTVVWLIVRKLTQPLRDLADSAEAVGKGNFSRRVEVRSRDECGDLAHVFNQMTENLQRSREQLETTVETLKTTQANLIQSEKLSGIGEFVAGVAHELNNPLTSVMGFSELLKQTSADPTQKRYLEMIHKSAARCTKIVQSLLSFSRRHKPERKLACVNRLVEAALEILAYQMRTSSIEVVTQLDPKLPQAMVDSHQLQQVFLNLINNARQAIEAAAPSGRIRLSSDTCGTNVRVIIQDSGPGIAPENLSKVFDPFFTTKDTGKGTGLGLSLCYGIVKEHRGKIEVRSRPGEGATFIVQLPIAADANDTDRLEKDEPFTPPADPREGKGRKVLVIDDEEPILQMVSDVLGGCGYDVETFSDGETALRQVNSRHYDLTLCDWKMPGLNGQQIYERLRATNPALANRMIFITGDVVSDRTQRFFNERNKVCLTKPFSLGEFRAAVSKALAEQ